MLDHKGLAFVFGNKHVLELNEIARVGDDANALVAAARFRLERRVIAHERHGFLKIEAHAIIARHSQDRLTITFNAAGAGRLRQHWCCSRNARAGQRKHRTAARYGYAHSEIPPFQKR
jgi:hypothetical protein